MYGMPIITAVWPHFRVLPLFLNLLWSWQADGYIARRFPSQRSVLGSVIDPLGDKLMVGIMSVCATYTGLFPCKLCTSNVGW